MHICLHSRIRKLGSATETLRHICLLSLAHRLAEWMQRVPCPSTRCWSILDTGNKLFQNVMFQNRKPPSHICNINLFNKAVLQNPRYLLSLSFIRPCTTQATKPQTLANQFQLLPYSQLTLSTWRTPVTLKEIDTSRSLHLIAEEISFAWRFLWDGIERNIAQQRPPQLRVPPPRLQQKKQQQQQQRVQREGFFQHAVFWYLLPIQFLRKGTVKPFDVLRKIIVCGSVLNDGSCRETRTSLHMVNTCSGLQALSTKALEILFW